MSTSKYLQIAPYILVEYIYDSKTYSNSAANFVRLDDSITGKTYIFNEKKDVDLTGNVQDRSTLLISNNRWVHLDIDRAIPYVSTVSDTLTQTNISDSEIVFNAKYDTINIHILSGYNLDDISGIQLEVKFPESNSVFTTISTQTYLKSDTWLNFNSRPIQVGERTYDRYIQVSIPSLSDINDSWQHNQDNPTGELGYYLSSKHLGFLNDGLIALILREIDSVETTNGQLYLTTGRQYSTTITQEDKYSKFSATIRESSDGDFFEYFPTWDGGFIEDYLNDLASVGGDYYVIHNIELYEQVGFSEILTSLPKNEIQSSGFTEPSRYRPIIINSDIAFGFSIDYTCRLVNRSDGSQIIRTASVSSRNTKKYGLKLDRIELQSSNVSTKIYNKVVNSTPLNIYQQTSIPQIETLFVPIFFEMNNLGTTVTMLRQSPDVTDITSDSFLNSPVVYGQGSAKILLGPFDNYLKFKLYDTSDRVTGPVAQDISNGTNLYIVFIDDSGTKKRFAKIITNDTNIQSTQGELLFKIPSIESTKILNYTNKKFYITSQVKGTSLGSTSDEVILYVGEFLPIDNIDEIRNYVDSLKTDILTQRANDLKALSTQLDAKSASLDALAQELETEKQRQATLLAQLTTQQTTLSTQQTTLDERTKQLSEQSALLNSEEENYRKFVKDSQEQYNSALTKLQDIIASLKTTTTSSTPSTTGTQSNLTVTEEDLILFSGGTLTSKPLVPLNIPEVPGMYGNDIGINDKKKLPLSYTDLTGKFLVTNPIK